MAGQIRTPLGDIPGMDIVAGVAGGIVVTALLLWAERHTRRRERRRRQETQSRLVLADLVDRLTQAQVIGHPLELTRPISFAPQGTITLGATLRRIDLATVARTIPSARPFLQTLMSFKEAYAQTETQAETLKRQLDRFVRAVNFNHGITSEDDVICRAFVTGCLFGLGEESTSHLLELPPGPARDRYRAAVAAAAGDRDLSTALEDLHATFAELEARFAQVKAAYQRQLEATLKASLIPGE